MGKQQKENRKKIKALKDATAAARPLIEEQLAVAKQAVDRATEIADQYNLPFCTGVSPLAQQYVPEQFKSIFGDLDPGIVEEITGADARNSMYNDVINGWQFSDVCY